MLTVSGWAGGQCLEPQGMNDKALYICHEQVRQGCPLPFSQGSGG